MNQIFSALDWVPTFVEIAGGPKGDGLKKEIEQGAYPGIVKTTLDGVNQIDYLTGKSDKSARDVFYYSRARRLRRFATRTGRCITPCPNREPRAGSCRLFRFTSPWSTTSSAIPTSRRWGSIRRPLRVCRVRWGHRRPPSYTTGTCCPSANSCGSMVRDAQRVPADAEAGELQPHPDYGSDEGERAPERLVEANLMLPDGRPRLGRPLGSGFRTVLSHVR